MIAESAARGMWAQFDAIILSEPVVGQLEKGYEEAIAQLGQSHRLIPNRVLSIVVPDSLVDRVVETVISTNKTGKAGDGKIFILPVSEAIRIRSAESGELVLDEA